MFGTTLYRLASVGSAIALTVGAAPAVQAQTGAAIELALPAQPLASALREIAVRSRTDVIAASDVVAGKQAPALQGRYTAEEAVRLLIAGSGLQVRRVGTSLVVVANPSGRADFIDDDANSGQIVVTGTNVRGAQPTSKVIVITREDIDRSGATSVDQLMRTVPQNTQGGTGHALDILPVAALCILAGFAARRSAALAVAWRGRREFSTNLGIWLTDMAVVAPLVIVPAVFLTKAIPAPAALVTLWQGRRSWSRWPRCWPGT